MADVKRVYTFGNKEAEGNGKMRELLGGKGANLAEMNLIGISRCRIRNLQCLSSDEPSRSFQCKAVQPNQMYQ